MFLVCKKLSCVFCVSSTIIGNDAEMQLLDHEVAASEFLMAMDDFFCSMFRK